MIYISYIIDMAIFDIHHPWAFTFGILGNIISIFVYLAPMPTFKRICKEKSTMGFDPLPYVVALFSAILWLYYALLKTNAILLISINSFGCVVEAVYIIIYLSNASKNARAHAAKLMGLINVGLLSLIFLLSFFLLKGSTRVHVVGWICVGVSVAVFAAPLSIVFQVVRTRSVEFMPFPLSFFLTLSAVMWFAYGLFQKDLCVALPNVIGFFLGVLQMSLYGVFRNMRGEDHVIAEEKEGNNVINIVVLGTQDVVPYVHDDDAPVLHGSQILSCDDHGISSRDDDNDDDRPEIFVPCSSMVAEPIQVKNHLQLESSPVQLVVCAA